MIDATNIKAPGWQRVVAELASSAPDDQTYLDRLLRIMAQVGAARQATLFVPTAGSSGELAPRPIAVFPGLLGAEGNTPDGATQLPPAERLEQARAVMRAAYACLESGQSRIFELGGDESGLYGVGSNAKSAGAVGSPGKSGGDGSGGPGNQGFVLAIALPSDPEQGRSGASTGSPQAGEAPSPYPVPACVTLLVEPRSRSAIQSTVAMSEVIAGYIHTHGLRQRLSNVQVSTRSLELATRLIGAVNSAGGFQGACLQLANDLAKLLRADRVSVGWATGGADSSVKVVAISDTEHFDRRTAMVQRLQSAMDECLDQRQPVLHPRPSAEQDVLLASSIAHAHRELAAGDTRLAIASVPLRTGDVTLGVLTVEAKAAETAAPGSPAIEPRAVELLLAAMDLVSPVLKVRQSDDRNLLLRTWDSTKWAGSWVVGTKQTAWKMAALAVMLALLFCTFYTTTYRVGATGELRAREKRVISIPFDGILRSKPPGIEPGVAVKAGQLLCEMDTIELSLQADEARSKLEQADKARSQAMKEGKISEARKAEAQRDGAQAQLSLLESRIERSKILAPTDGVLISGDLRDKLGAAVKLGDELFQLAPMDDMIAVAKVDERDIALLTVGGKGNIATRSRPGDRHELTIERIVPLGTAEEGKTVFEVRTKLDNVAAWMRPGMEGVIRLDAGDHSLLYIGTRRVVETVRLWVW